MSTYNIHFYEEISKIIPQIIIINTSIIKYAPYLFFSYIYLAKVLQNMLDLFYSSKLQSAEISR